MKVIEPGHIYQLQHLDGSGAGILVFVNREPGTEHEGVQTQEVLRALIDRTQHCDSCLRWDGNDKIIHHLRMALALHESRAIERKVEKGEMKPEIVPIGEDGHFVIGHKLFKAQGNRVTCVNDLGEPKTTDYCTKCGESPESGTHWVGGPDSHPYEDPRVRIFRREVNGDRMETVIVTPNTVEPYKCNVPMCGESGVCEECRKRGAK